MPRELNAAESARVFTRYRHALEAAHESDCREAQFGAAIFDGSLGGSSAIITGFNHVPKELSSSCLLCPRREFPQLRRGVGAELCFAVHAEEDAINKLNNPASMLRTQDEPRARMVVAHLKDGKEVLPKHNEIPFVRCTACAKKLATETRLHGILFPAIREDIVFIEFERVEFLKMSVHNLSAGWRQFMAGLHPPQNLPVK